MAQVTKSNVHLTAEEKAKRADADTPLMLPVWGLWSISGMLAILLLIGIAYVSRLEVVEGKIGWVAVLAIMGSTSFQFACMAIYKWNRDRHWQALDANHKLELQLKCVVDGTSKYTSYEMFRVAMKEAAAQAKNLSQLRDDVVDQKRDATLAAQAVALVPTPLQTPAWKDIVLVDAIAMLAFEPISTEEMEGTIRSMWLYYNP